MSTWYTPREASYLYSQGKSGKCAEVLINYLTKLTVWRFLLKKQVKIYHLLFITFLRVQLDMGTLA